MRFVRGVALTAAIAPLTRPMKACLALLALSAAIRLALALGTDVYFDEAYYWQWSQRLDWGYYDHPPLVAWLIAALGIRPMALLCGAGTVAAVWGLARDVHGHAEAAWRAAALWSCVPIAILSGVWATPDTPLLLFWTLALWALWRERWLLAGLALGLALLSKYSALLLGVAFLAAAVRRRRLPLGAWGTALLGALLFLPVVLWNARLDWAGFAFQLHHGLGGKGGLKSFLEFLGGQLALGGPVLLPLALVYVFRGEREQLLLKAAAVVPLLFFGFAALRTRGEANWPAMAYIAACVGVAGLRPPKALEAAAWSGLAVVLAVGSHLLFPLLRFQRDVPLERTQGWAVLAALAEPGRLFPDAGATPIAVVYAPNYQLASQAAHYAHLPVDTAGPARPSQYDAWPRPPVAPGQDALWCSERELPPDELVARFTTLEGPVELPADFQGRRVHTFRVWRLRSARPPDVPAGASALR
ncbi:ArnT family glycosyltransferase [Stigmatella erecta]|uniref:Dolichyl-phosphate-mannose-protein mannosyltransferase n=1 Tax=Stigmatella erecta TaxID=83460 RepID=A0A1I0DUU2_9BACT|nr:glycosyltransferase family 39 protein [Stigmatella erecta]SET36423.1 Dolichyl-phosphate-mannose-protein mannosyltransferase [Stigmatella erecta]